MSASDAAGPASGRSLHESDLPTLAFGLKASTPGSPGSGFRLSPSRSARQSPHRGCQGRRRVGRTHISVVSVATRLARVRIRVVSIEVELARIRIRVVRVRVGPTVSPLWLSASRSLPPQSAFRASVSRFDRQSPHSGCQGLRWLGQDLHSHGQYHNRPCPAPHRSRMPDRLQNPGLDSGVTITEPMGP